MGIEGGERSRRREQDEDVDEARRQMREVAEKLEGEFEEEGEFDEAEARRLMGELAERLQRESEEQERLEEEEAREQMKQVVTKIAEDLGIDEEELRRDDLESSDSEEGTDEGESEEEVLDDIDEAREDLRRRYVEDMHRQIPAKEALDISRAEDAEKDGDVEAGEAARSQEGTEGWDDAGGGMAYKVSAESQESVESSSEAEESTEVAEGEDASSNSEVSEESRETPRMHPEEEGAFEDLSDSEDQPERIERQRQPGQGEQEEDQSRETPRTPGRIEQSHLTEQETSEKRDEGEQDSDTEGNSEGESRSAEEDLEESASQPEEAGNETEASQPERELTMDESETESTDATENHVSTESGEASREEMPEKTESGAPENESEGLLDETSEPESMESEEKSEFAEMEWGPAYPDLEWKSGFAEMKMGGLFPDEKKSERERLKEIWDKLSEKQREMIRPLLRKEVQSEEELKKLVKQFEIELSRSPDFRADLSDALEYLCQPRELREQREQPRLIQRLQNLVAEHRWGEILRGLLAVPDKDRERLAKFRSGEFWTKELIDAVLSLSVLSISPSFEKLIENPRFFDRYRRCLSWLAVMSQKSRGLIKDPPDTEQVKELSLKHGVSPQVIRSWIRGTGLPMLIVQLERRLGFRSRPGGFRRRLKLPVAKSNRYDTVFVSNALQALSPKMSIKSGVEALSKLIESGERGVRFCDLRSEARFKDRAELERFLSLLNREKEVIGKRLTSFLASLGFESYRVRIGVNGHSLYIRVHHVDEFDWLNLLSSELFYFDKDYKRELVGKSLGLLELSSVKHLSKLVRQLTDYGRLSPVPAGGTNADLQSKSRYLSGETLSFLIDVLGEQFGNIQRHVKIIGMAQRGKWQIRDPSFPRDEDLLVLLARLYAIIVCDGNINRRSFAVSYTEKSEERRRRVVDITRELGEVRVSEQRNKNRTDGLAFPSIIGRLLHKLGMPAGDKVLVGARVPSFILNGSERVQRAYLEELVPEEGSITYDVYGGLKILWGRSVVLRETRESRKYASVDLVSPKMIRMIVDKGQYEEKRKCFRLSAGDLRDLKYTGDHDLARLAGELEMLVRKHPPKLMMDEQKLCKNNGISTGRHLCYVRYYTRSKRVSAHWEAHTRGRQDVLQWWMVAPPNDVRKRKRLKQWVMSHLSVSSRGSEDQEAR